MDVRYEGAKMRDKVLMAIVWRLPVRLVMYCFYRVTAYATTGKYGKTVVPELTTVEAAWRWHEDHGL